MAKKNRAKRAHENPRHNNDSRNERFRRVLEPATAGSPQPASELLATEIRHRFMFGQPSANTTRFAAHQLSAQYLALDAAVNQAARTLISAGWTPADLDAICLRKGVGLAGRHLLDVVAAITAEHPALLVHRQWQVQLVTVGAETWWRPGRSPACEWAARADLNWPAALELLLDLLALVAWLPAIAIVLPPPGDPANARQKTGGGQVDVDAKILGRVRALLAKAEATEFPEEADALTAKAQQLMTQYSIDRALADDRGEVRQAALTRRLWLDNPYLSAKFLLVGAVARANNCNCVLSKELGFSTLIGHDSDLRLVEMLTTSLLVQATRAMTATGPWVSLSGVSSTRSYRQSFLVSYASRIGERLSESAHVARAAAEAASQGSLLPVLVARERIVADATATLFPDLRTTRISTSNREGWSAGRAAADQARLDVSQAVHSR